MFQIKLSPKAIFKQLGIDADEDLVELGTMFWLRYSNAHDKMTFIKDALRKALVKDERITRR
jgi:hypothetical protein